MVGTDARQLTIGEVEPITTGPADAGSSGRLLRSYALLAGATIASQLIGMVVLAIVARTLGPEYLGAYAFAASITLYFTLPLMPGITTLAIRDYARADSKPAVVVSEVQLLMGVNALLAYGLLLALAGVLVPDESARTLLPIAGLMLIVNAFSLDWTLQAMQNAKALSAWRLAGQVVFGLVTPFVVNGGLEGARTYAWCNIAGYLITAVGAGVWVWRSQGRPYQRVSLRAAARRARRSLPFGISLVMVQIYVSLDVLLLGWIGTSKQVGEYAAAAKIPLALSGLAGMWVVILYPHASVLFKDDREALRRQVSKFTGLGIMVALPLIPIGFVAGDQIVEAVFGSAFAPAAASFAVLLCSTTVVIVNSNIGNLLLACNDEKAFMYAVTAGAVLNLGLNLLLIPPIGILGSALATLAAESLVLTSMTWRFQRIVGRITLELRRVASAVIATLALTAALLLLAEVSFSLLELPVALLLYPAVLVATRGLSRADLTALRARP